MIKNIILDTPTYVWFIAAALVWVGYNSCFTRVVHISRIIIVPLLFIYSVCQRLQSLFGITNSTVFTAITSLIAGSLLGVALTYKNKIEADRKNLFIKIPGDYVTLIVILLNFTSQYTVNVLYHLDREMFTRVQFLFLIAINLLTGITVGRCSIYLYRFFTAKALVELC